MDGDGVDMEPDGGDVVVRAEELRDGFAHLRAGLAAPNGLSMPAVVDPASSPPRTRDVSPEVAARVDALLARVGLLHVPADPSGLGPPGGDVPPHAGFVTSDGVHHRLEIGGSLIIGRSGGEGRHQIADAELSRGHVRLELLADGLHATDLHSTNGTMRANDRGSVMLDPGRPIKLEPGDRLHVPEGIALCTVVGALR